MDIIDIFFQTTTTTNPITIGTGFIALGYLFNRKLDSIKDDLCKRVSQLEGLWQGHISEKDI